MWIIPSNLHLSSVSALEYLASKEDLKELALIAVSWPTWKSKPSSLPTWLRAWKRVYWIPHLFGRTLKPSMHARFVEEYTASLEVIHVPDNHLPGFENGICIRDSFGRLYADLSRQQDLFGAFSKTWTITCRERIRLYNEAYEIWVTQLRQESTRRLKRAVAIYGKDYTSSRWTTPTSRDYKDSFGMCAQRKDGKSRLEQLARQVFHWHKVSGKWNGNNRVLMNPDWVAQLMGTTLEKTFFMHTVTV